MNILIGYNIFCVKGSDRQIRLQGYQHAAGIAKYGYAAVFLRKDSLGYKIMGRGIISLQVD